jgi:hypothetical protein
VLEVGVEADRITVAKVAQTSKLPGGAVFYGSVSGKNVVAGTQVFGNSTMTFHSMLRTGSGVGLFQNMAAQPWTAANHRVTPRSHWFHVYVTTNAAYSRS